MVADLLAVVAQQPDAACIIVAVNVGPLQVGQAIGVINVATGQRAELRVFMLDDGRQDRRRAELALRTERMAAFLDAPTVIAAFLELVNRLPEVLAHLADPQVSRRLIEAKLPRLAQAIGIDLRP